MKKIWMAAVATMAMASCELNTSDNGDLDGFWQMTRVDTLDTGGSTDTRSRLIFWSVQADMLEMKGLSETELNPLSVFFRFRLEDGKLVLSNPVADNREISDSLVTHPSVVKDYGLSSLNETFEVKTLDSKKMVLDSEHHLRLYFRKY